MKVDYRLDEHPVCPALFKLPGEGVPAWRCRCTRPGGRALLRKYRHQHPWECFSVEDVKAFWAEHPEIKTIGNARRLKWLWETFAPIPEREIPF